MSTHHITFEPTDLSVDVPAGTTVVQAARMAGICIDTPCDGSGTCGKCRVRFTTGAPKAEAEEQATFSDEQRAAGRRFFRYRSPDPSLNALCGDVILELAVMFLNS